MSGYSLAHHPLLILTYFCCLRHRNWVGKAQLSEIFVSQGNSQGQCLHPGALAAGQPTPSPSEYPPIYITHVTVVDTATGKEARDQRSLLRVTGFPRWEEARALKRAGKLVQLSEVCGGPSYLSQSDLRLHFGLAENEKMNEVSIRWPNGETERLRDVPAVLSTRLSREVGFTTESPFRHCPSDETRGRVESGDKMNVPVR